MISVLLTQYWRSGEVRYFTQSHTPGERQIPNVNALLFRPSWGSHWGLQELAFLPVLLGKTLMSTY